MLKSKAVPSVTVSAPLKDEDFQVSGWCGNRRRCVAVAIRGNAIGVRDTKDPSKQTLMFDKEEWSVFVKGVKAGQFDPK